MPATCCSVDAVMSVEPGEKIIVGRRARRIPMESAKTKDITVGVPRVAELFEARRPKDHAIIAEIDGTIRFGRDYKNKRRIILEPNEAWRPAGRVPDPEGQAVPSPGGRHHREGRLHRRRQSGAARHPGDQGRRGLAAYLVNEIQEVYRLQGVTINDKHIEVIVRQMLQKVEITDPGDTGMLQDEQIDKPDLDVLNDRMVAEGKKPAEAVPVLLGITKARLQTRSFFSAASFQETTRVLTEAAVQGKADPLEGLKENIIVGRLIPAGTGGAITNKVIATKRDELILEERRRQAATDRHRRGSRWSRPSNRSRTQEMRKGPLAGPFLVCTFGLLLSIGGATA